ncbi:putative Heat shock protein DnaJ, cysteine-rich [Medicago truncatula]|uniref:Chaperon protein P13.9, putative n=1 Tax=Medicago truncatula TaxID=3880 RepID=A0A072VCQ1_MEDTR|nr:protein BUNDLE SHEATH DEFECTIVE 2, chloroplastic [Medicago truncatula]KEH35920.1 chaperon protein P13.9, putative [Medicago truncatula]RHN70650.1 putative Heat shock protein DnaJ, cysteine-rich [Medicago truncatula]
MVSALCLTPSCLGTKIFCVQTSECSGLNITSHTNTNRKHFRVNYGFQGPPTEKYCLVTAKATNDNQQNTKPNSVICADCDGNGAIVCSQCKGSGVNSVDIFDGLFKAGASCWLCGGRKEMLCGNCNGAGFIGGFLSTYDQ